MKNTLIIFAAGSIVLALSGTVRAQYRPNQFGKAPTYGPAWSPYLNLFRRGNSPAFNYFSLVRPELQFRKQFQLINQQFGSVQQSITSLQQQQQAGALPPTGHTVGFMTHSRFFMTMGSGGGTGRTAAPSPTKTISPASRFAAPKTNPGR